MAENEDRTGRKDKSKAGKRKASAKAAPTRQRSSVSPPSKGVSAKSGVKASKPPASKRPPKAKAAREVREDRDDDEEER